jgi:monoterpene epsilon-lactone hydrolase
VTVGSVTDPTEEAIRRVQQVYGSWRRDTPVAQMREDWDRLFAAAPSDAETQSVLIDGMAALWVATPGSERSRVLLYFHGGGYKLGSVRSHVDLMARIARAARCRVLGVNYRLAPEHHFPAAVHDAIAAYECLLAERVPAHCIALAGDSAGGGLAAASLLALRDRARPLPAAAVMLSAWTDLTAQSDTYATRARADPIHQRTMILATARQYLGEQNEASHPLASPLFGDLAGLPPLLLQVGDRETVLGDSTRFADKARAAGVEVTLEVYPDMIHVFQQFADLIPEAQQAIDSIGCFLSRVWAQNPGAHASC